jgi:hypothetical protein
LPFVASIALVFWLLRTRKSVYIDVLCKFDEL